MWTARLLAAPTVLGVAATSGIALLHPRRAGRSPQQRGKQGQSHHRWMVGGKLGFGWNPGGLICAWDWATANVHDPHFQPLMAQVDHLMIVLPAPGCHAKTGDPAPLTVGQRGPWNPWMRVATVLSMLTTVLPSKQVRQRVWAYCRARVGWTMAAFHLFARWGLEIADENMVRLSIAEFSL